MQCLAFYAVFLQAPFLDSYKSVLSVKQDAPKCSERERELMCQAMYYAKRQTKHFCQCTYSCIIAAENLKRQGRQSRRFRVIGVNTVNTVLQSVEMIHNVLPVGVVRTAVLHAVAFQSVELLLGGDSLLQNG